MVRAVTGWLFAVRSEMPVHAHALWAEKVPANIQAKIINLFIGVVFRLEVKRLEAGSTFFTMPISPTVKTRAKAKKKRKNIFICINAKYFVPLQANWVIV